MVDKLVLYGFVLLLLLSCKAKVPQDIIERDAMEDILYDYHLAQSLAKGGNDSVEYRIRLYTDAVFRKHGINEDKFNHSMEWYTRNSEELFNIYKKIDKRFAEARSTGVVKGNPYAAMTAPGDTMNIWEGKDFYLLTSEWNNHIDFQQRADSTFSKGDKIMWQFETHWYYREGQKNAMAVLSLVYENDSAASTTQNLYSTGKQEMYVTVGNKPLKSIEGFVYLTSPWTEIPKILTISEPVLVKFKKSQQPALKMKDVLQKTEEEKAGGARETQKGENNTKSLEIDERIRMTNTAPRSLSLPR